MNARAHFPPSMKYCLAWRPRGRQYCLVWRPRGRLLRFSPWVRSKQVLARWLHICEQESKFSFPDGVIFNFDSGFIDLTRIQKNATGWSGPCFVMCKFDRMELGPPQSTMATAGSSSSGAPAVASSSGMALALTLGAAGDRSPRHRRRSPPKNKRHRAAPY